MAKQLILLRHGQSVWNRENRFTGWKDVELTDQGKQEAEFAGQSLLDADLHFDVAFTSVLKRAIKTLWIVQEKMDLMWTPVIRSWKLNERHYGGLTGLNKAETAEKHGEEQVLIWRRSYSTPPPLMEKESDDHPSRDRKYSTVDPDLLPSGEALLQTKERVLPFWNESIVPAIQSGQRVLIAAHGNSLRALIQHLDGLDEDAIMKVNVPTGIPLVYELDDDLKPLSSKYLADQDKIAAAMHEVASQGKAH